MSRSYTSSPPSASMVCSGTAFFELLGVKLGLDSLDISWMLLQIEHDCYFLHIIQFIIHCTLLFNSVQT
jgi:hypothetical protein